MGKDKSIKEDYMVIESRSVCKYKKICPFSSGCWGCCSWRNWKFYCNIKELMRMNESC